MVSRVDGSEQSEAVATTAEVVADQPEAVATTAEEMDGSEVLATAEEIPDGCGCPVCLSFLVEPLTLRCGHSFCRLCLIQSTTLSPDGRSCPLCRSEVDIHDPATHAASEALEIAVRAAVDGDDYEARRAAHAAALAELRVKQATELPIFFMHPGTRVGGTVGLHLFEPRYKVLIRRAWEGGKEFVYCGCVPRVGAPGVVVRVDDAHFFPDGRCCIRGVGVRRVELGATWIEDGTGGLFITRVRDPAAAERAAPAAPPAAPAAGRLPITGGQGCAVM